MGIKNVPNLLFVYFMNKGIGAKACFKKKKRNVVIEFSLIAEISAKTISYIDESPQRGHFV